MFYTITTVVGSVICALCVKWGMENTKDAAAYYMWAAYGFMITLMQGASLLADRIVKAVEKHKKV